MSRDEDVRKRPIGEAVAVEGAGLVTSRKSVMDSERVPFPREAAGSGVSLLLWSLQSERVPPVSTGCLEAAAAVFKSFRSGALWVMFLSPPPPPPPPPPCMSHTCSKTESGCVFLFVCFFKQGVFTGGGGGQV